MLLTHRAVQSLARLTVDLGAIRRNVSRIRELSGSRLMAVVKADAFGHGAVDVARTALSAGAEWLGVATIDEALVLRRAGISAPILAWLSDPLCPLEQAVAANVTLSCANVETLDAVARAARAVGEVANVHLECDTGMSRSGASLDAWPSLCADAALAQSSGWVRVGGVWSHLANASDPDLASVVDAVRNFERAVATAREAGLDPLELHLANSAAALAHPTTKGTMVRCAAAICGIETVRGRTHGLESAMRLESRIVQLRRIPAGVGVGYGHEFVSHRPTTLALLPLGYADGIPRQLAGRGSVVIRGQRMPIVGVISMDQCVVDVGDTAVELGETIMLLGNSMDGEPDAAEWATLAGTLPHDIMAGFGARIERVAVNRS